MMTNSNSQNFKESRSHGTSVFPCAFYCFQSRENELIVKHHWHDELEIIYFAEGDFYLDINMQKYEIAGPCFCLLDNGVFHSIASRSACYEQAVVFHPKMLSFDIYDLSQEQLIQPLINQSLSFPLFITSEFSCYDVLLREFKEISESFHVDSAALPTQHSAVRPASQLRIKAALLKMLASLSDSNLLILKQKTTDHRIEAIKKVLTYIKEHYTEKIYIRDLAGLVNMNEQYFCRFFKQSLGKSPVQYINDLRIRHSFTLLKDTDMQVMEICLECGFHNLGNFLREFKKAANTTPLQYRKTNHTRKSE